MKIVESGTGLLLVTITDNGAGMSKPETEKALDPFFTTKSGKRFGLGLALFKQAGHSILSPALAWVQRYGLPFEWILPI